MNAIKTCEYMGKIDPYKVCNALYESSRSLITMDNILIILRFVEIFDFLLLDLNDDASLSPWTELFSLNCAKFMSSDFFEVNCTLIKYFIDIIIYDCGAFIKNQKELWGSFNLRFKVPLGDDLETEGKFST